MLEIVVSPKADKREIKHCSQVLGGTWEGTRSASTGGGHLLLLSSPENLFQEKENLLDSKDPGL